MFKKYYYNGKETMYSISDDGKIRNDKTGKELKGTYLSCEFQKVSLIIEGKAKTFMAHRLVAETFIPNPSNLPCVYHIDGNKINNKAENLRWGSISEGNQRISKPFYNENNIANFDEDEWKEIPYISGYKASKAGQICNASTGRILKGSRRNGYARVDIKSKTYSVHILIYETFIGKIPSGMVIDHINGIRDDNRLENLRCVSQSDNMYNAQKNGHKGQHKVAQYDLKHNLIKEYPSCTAAAKEMGVTYRAISSAAERGGTSCGYFWKKILI